MVKGTAKKCSSSGHHGHKSRTCITLFGVYVTSNPATARRSKRSRNCKGKPNSKRWQLEKLRSNWSDLPRDISECLIGRLPWVDRIRMREICKDWSAPNHDIPFIDKLPWEQKEISWSQAGNHQIDVECRVLEPISRKYVMRGRVLDPFSRECVTRGKDCRAKKCRAIHVPLPLASVDGWFLFSKPVACKFETHTSYFLYSPFTNEVVKLPKFIGLETCEGSPKSVIFQVALSTFNSDNYVKLYSAGDYSWKSFKCSGLKSNKITWPASVAYANGVFFCLFADGHLGAFNVEYEEWSIVNEDPPPETLCWVSALIASDACLWL